MNILPPKKRKENRRSVEEPHTPEETSISDSNSPSSPLPITDLQLPVCSLSSVSSTPISEKESNSTESFCDTPQLSLKIKDETKDMKVLNRKRNMDEEKNESEEEIESGINDLSLKNGHQLNSSNFENVHTGPEQDQARAMMHMMAQRIFRPLMPPLLQHPFFPYSHFLIPSTTASRPLFLRPSQATQQNNGSPMEGNSESSKTRDSEQGMTKSEIDRVVSMPPEEFQDHCQQRSLSEVQTNMFKDVRRKGKNKVAAQKCRQRKLDEIEEYKLKVGVKQKEVLLGEITLKENQAVRENLVDKFGKLQKELEDHKKESLGCSEHSEFTKSCLGKRGCRITIRLIHS